MEVYAVKRTIILLVLVIVILALGSTSVLAGSGDEHFNGEDGDQPAPGAVESPGEGLPSEAPNIGLRTRAFL